MRLVYVYALSDPDERRYLFRAPLWQAWLLSKWRPEFDYALFWFQGGTS